ncbi:NHL repeat-containing protein [Daejeonella lutea]|uniref:Lactonase, 7-bladed beta-propeller n=1 Tax=Daejeonella lutea TaxID=572036 RepID=A0A1T5D8W1_9SPHI|nr:hypothetical protein [Daejeonella lutea]SKB68192.1 hypothetical protein SAMN05661099_2226 [Daejeonella lutea]
MNRHFLAAFVILTAALFSGCTKDDNEPLLQSTVSRLYVSNADTDASVMSTMVFDPADAATLDSPDRYDTKLPDGNGIFFDPYSGTVYQVSRQAKNIRSFTVKPDGSLTQKGSFIDDALPSAREIAFDRVRKTLYIASNSDSSLYVYVGIDTIAGTARATKKLKLDGQPWGIHLEDDNLFVVMDKNRVEVQLFEKASSMQVGTIVPTKKITIAGATRLHGITYSSTRDALILTDIGEPSAPGFKTDGKIFIIETVLAKFDPKGALITPTRVISGLGTSLGNPVDVAWDSRAGKDIIYVAEKANQQILVFKFQDNGNASPQRIATLTSFPEAIYLDAR